MVEKVFKIDENYSPIIKQTLENKFDCKQIYNAKYITTGWTNIVYEVESDKGNFFFRFPRDEFWKRTIVKDCQFANYIKNKTSFQTVDLNLCENNSREFSVHKKIIGTPLADKMETMSQEEISKVAKQISKFMYELHNLKFDKNQIFSINNIGLNLNDFIQELLDIHLSDNDKAFWKQSNFKVDEDICLVHGDLNSSNILLDDDNNITAIIDFGFAGLGNKYFDISRIIGRCPESFKSEIINSYQELDNKKLDMNYLNKNIDTWKNIDQGYINYMKRDHIIG